jgi:hypothetical protein
MSFTILKFLFFEIINWDKMSKGCKLLEKSQAVKLEEEEEKLLNNNEENREVLLFC